LALEKDISTQTPALRSRITGFGGERQRPKITPAFAHATIFSLIKTAGIGRATGEPI
jgi:hypothetical protein